MKTCALAFLLSLAGCTASLHQAGRGADGLTLIGCPAGQRQKHVSVFAEARSDALEWMRSNGYVIKEEDFTRKAEIFCTRDAARKRLSEVFGVRSADIPDHFSGTVQGDTLFLVSESLYRQNFVQLYGPESWREDEYERLAVHELVHRAHEIVALRLFGSADGMGPTWVYEGLAIEAAGQFSVSRKEIDGVTLDEFLQFVQEDANGAVQKPVYVQYSKYFRYIRTAVSDRWVIEHAGQEGFVDQLVAALREREP